MKIEGSHEIAVPRQLVWDAFLDPARLQQAIPGCEKLDLVDEVLAKKDKAKHPFA